MPVSPVSADAAGRTLIARRPALPDVLFLNSINSPLAETTETPETNTDLARTSRVCLLGQRLGHRETSLYWCGVIGDLLTSGRLSAHPPSPAIWHRWARRSPRAGVLTARRASYLGWLA